MALRWNVILYQFLGERPATLEGRFVPYRVLLFGDIGLVEGEGTGFGRTLKRSVLSGFFIKRVEILDKKKDRNFFLSFL